MTATHIQPPAGEFGVAVWLEPGPSNPQGEWALVGPFESRDEAADYASHYEPEDVAVVKLSPEPLTQSS